MADRALVDGGWAAVEGMFSKLVGSTTRTTQPEITSRVEAMMQSTAPQAIATAQRAMAGRRDFTNELPLIDVPTLVITGSEDEIAPPDVTKDWAGRIPNSKYFCVPSSGHLTPMEQPVRFNELLRLAFSH